MKSKILSWAVFACAIIFLGSVSSYIYARIVNPNPLERWHYVSLGNGIHVAVMRGLNCDLVCYNGDLPYLGSIISIENDRKINVRGWNGFGVYLRLIKNTDVGKTWWTLIINLWYPIVIFGILSIVLVLKRLFPTKRTPLVCRKSESRNQ
jgi:hypothetical protein